MGETRRDTRPPVEETDRRPDPVLESAAGAARFAPSIHNTQPWHWIIDGDTLRLRAERDRQLSGTDPSGRMLTISCGTALHHVTTAIAGQGWRPEVDRFPDADDPELLAAVTLGPIRPNHAADTEMFGALTRRHTDRRPLRMPPPGPDVLEEIRSTADRDGSHVYVLRPDQLVTLAAAATTARDLDLADAARRRELEEWVGPHRPESAGVPGSTFPERLGEDNVVPRFPAPEHSGGMPGRDTDSAARFLVLFTDTDDPPAWLRAGETLSRAWGAATMRDLAVMPISSVVELEAARAHLYRILSHVGHPQFVVRLGHPDARQPEPARTERLDT